MIPARKAAARAAYDGPAARTAYDGPAARAAYDSTAAISTAVAAAIGPANRFLGGGHGVVAVRGCDGRFSDSSRSGEVGLFVGGSRGLFDRRCERFALLRKRDESLGFGRIARFARARSLALIGGLRTLDRLRALAHALGHACALLRVENAYDGPGELDVAHRQGFRPFQYIRLRRDGVGVEALRTKRIQYLLERRSLTNRRGTHSIDRLANLLLLVG